MRNDLNLGTSGRRLTDKLDEERLSMRIAEVSSFLSGLPLNRRGEDGWVFVASVGQDIPIQAVKGYEAATGCRKFVRGEKLVHGEKW
jgi:hypothetical protein